MKKIAAIILLFVFAFNLGGFFLVFKIKQYYVRQEIKHRIKQGVPDDELILITVTPAIQHKLEWEFEWEDEKEFRYEGMMYDVVKTEVIDETTIAYYCISDEQETTLFANLDEQVKKNRDINNDNTENDSLEDMFKLLSDIYAQPQKDNTTFIQPNATTTFEYVSHYSSHSLDIASPPPKMG